MSHADPSARQLGFLHGSSLEAGTSPHIVVLPPAEGALACQTPSGGRRGDATSRDAVSLPGVNGHDGIGNPGTGGSRGKTEKATDADQDVPRNIKPLTELELETVQALDLDRLMAEANVGCEGVPLLLPKGLEVEGEVRVRVVGGLLLLLRLGEDGSLERVTSVRDQVRARPRAPGPPRSRRGRRGCASGCHRGGGTGGGRCPRRD